jgi:hypothetical protein
MIVKQVIAQLIVWKMIANVLNLSKKRRRIKMGRRRGDWMCWRPSCRRMNVNWRDTCDRCGRQRLKEEVHYICKGHNNCFYDDEEGAKDCCTGKIRKEKHYVCSKCGMCKWGEIDLHDCANCKEGATPNLKTTEDKV